MAFIGNNVQTQGFTPAIDYFNGNGVTVTFTLSRPVASVAQMIVAVDNVIQNPSSAFNVSGNAITFTSAPLSGTNNIWVEYTSLITTYQGISQDPSVIGDITATGGFLSTGDFGNSFIDGAVIDYVTGAGRITVGELDNLIFYHGGTSGRSELMKLSYAGNSTLEGALTATGAGSFQGVYIGKGGGSLATNTAVGASALAATNASGYCSAFGYQALTANTSAVANDAFGYGALKTNTSGSNNAAFGVNALTTNSSGGSNTAIGISALTSNTTASYNTAVGYQAGYSNTVYSYHTYVGYQAGYSNVNGVYNTFIGYQAGYNSNPASNANTVNTFVGYYAGQGTTTGVYNTFIGPACAYTVTTGSKNTVIGGYNGNQGGLDIRTASNRIVLSDGDGNPRASWDNNGAMLTKASSGWGLSVANSDTSSPLGVWVQYTGSPSNPDLAFAYNNNGWKFYVIGSGAIYSTSTSITSLSDQREKENIRDLETGLSEILALQPRRFDWKEGRGTNTKNVAGFIAQEVETVLPELVSQYKSDKTDEIQDYKSVRMGDILPTLVKAIQEQQELIKSLTARIAALEAK